MSHRLLLLTFKSQIMHIWLWKNAWMYCGIPHGYINISGHWSLFNTGQIKVNVLLCPYIPSQPELHTNVFSICKYLWKSWCHFSPLWVFIACLLPQVVFCKFREISSTQLLFTIQANLIIIVLSFWLHQSSEGTPISQRHLDLIFPENRYFFFFLFFICYDIICIIF